MTETLLPDEKVLRLDAVECQPDLLIIRATTCTEAAVCPHCGIVTRRVHSRYRRTLSDLPFRTTPVRIQLTARKFFCTDPMCPQKVFAERIPSVASRHAQKTARLAALLREFAWLTGGEVAVRIGALLGITASGDALLDALTAAQTQRAAAATPRVLGIDDFAFRRRCRYGTVLVDMEQHRPIDLLPDREAKTLEDWLREHPGVEIVCRDRSTVYTEAVTKAAPNAVQVADRWHLVKNLSEALMRFFDQQQAALKQAAPLLACQEGALPVVWPPTKGAAVEQERRDHRGKRLARYEQVVALHRQGVSLRAIARQLGLARTRDRRTVCRL